MSQFKLAIEGRLRELAKQSLRSESKDELGSERSTREASPEPVEPESVGDLVLDGTVIKTLSSEDVQYLKSFENLTKLSLNQSELSSLESFPLLPKLRNLELTDNRLTNLAPLPDVCPAAVSLALSGNRIKVVEDLSPLKRLPGLVHLGLEMNPVAETEGYRSQVFEMLPNLVSLDGFDRNGKEVEVEDDDECDEEEQDGDEEDDTTLRDFYVTDYVSGEGNEEEDGAEFVPNMEADDDDEEEEEEDEEEDEADADEEENNEDSSEITNKASAEGESKAQRRGEPDDAEPAKRARVQ